MTYIPRADKDFYEWQKNFVAYAETHAAALKIPPEAIAALKGTQQSFETDYAAWENPNHGKLDVAAKNDARTAHEQAIRGFIKGFLYNPAVSDTDRRSMGIPDPKPHTPVPIPTTYPEFEVDSSIIRRLIIHYRDNGSKSKAKPHGVHDAEIRWGISETSIRDPDELSGYDCDTASPFTLEFQGHERGKTVQFCLRWKNNRGEKGPWGEIGSAVVP